METVIFQNTDKKLIFRLFKADLREDNFHFGYQRRVSSQRKYHTRSNRYLFRHIFFCMKQNLDPNWIVLLT